MKKAIAIPLGMLTVVINSSSERDDGIRGVCSDGEDSRPSAIMKDGDEILVVRKETIHWN